RFLDLSRNLRGPVDLVQVNHVHVQPAQAVLTLGTYPVCADHAPHVAIGIPFESALGEDVRPWPAPLIEGAPDDILRVPQAVHRRGIDPVDPVLQGTMYCAYGLVVILRAPPRYPAGSADSPRPETEARDVQVGIAQ